MPYIKTTLIPTLLIILVQNVNGLNPLVKTNMGLIKGLKATDGDYSMFLGIPYAKVDLENPFGPSTPYLQFNETFEAYDDSAKCPQFDNSVNTGVGTLDCLHLNIHVPNSANSRNRLPVMVFIHGGSFATGFGGRHNFGTKFLVRHDVIVVTLNYRVGVYGFMCLGTPEVPGNAGLKDQLIALRWVNANIQEFGGDPDRVTIFGQSAGARAVDFHLMANDEYLFNKVILQSGNSVSSPSISNVNTELPVLLAKNLGFQTDDFRQAVEYLTSVEPQLLVSTAFIVVGPMFQACVEKSIDGVEGYVTDFTINRKIPKVKTTPILTGFNNNEKYSFHASVDESYYKDRDFFGDFIKIYFTFNEKELMTLEKLVNTFYTGDEGVSVNVKQELADFDSDFTYIHPIQRGIAQYILNGAKNIYYYMFSYEGERNLFKKSHNMTASGAVHGDDISYLFDLERFSETPTSADQLMIDRMTTMWTNFAKYGDPTPETSTLLPVKWEPITEANWYYYSIDSELKLKRRPLHSRMSFLDLFFEMNKHLQKGLRRTEHEEPFFNIRNILGDTLN